MNSVVAENTIQDAINIFPEATFNISTNISNGQTYIYLDPDSLAESTSYTVTIDTILEHYYGGNLKEPYSFTFVTE